MSTINDYINNRIVECINYKEIYDKCEPYITDPNEIIISVEMQELDKIITYPTYHIGIRLSGKGISKDIMLSTGVRIT